MKRSRLPSVTAILIAVFLLAAALPVYALEDSEFTAEQQTAGEEIVSEELPAAVDETVTVEYVPEEDETADTFLEQETAEDIEIQEAAEDIDAQDAAEDIKTTESPEESVDAEKEETEQPKRNEAGEEESEETEAEEAEAEEELVNAEGTPSISYQTHVQTYGWKPYVKDGEMSGTSGESKRLEGIRILVDGVEGLGVEYRTHVQTYGWREYVRDGEMSGTSGESKRLEAINIRLTGEAASDYDVYYCVHVQTFGWLGWAKNGEMAGTAGYSKRLEGIRILVQPKESAAPAAVGSCAIPALFASIEYQTHVQTYGWQDYAANGIVSGTTGQSKRLEGIRIRLGECCVPGSVRYRTHVQTYGWETAFAADDAVSGTSGQSKRLEAIEIALEGEIASYYDVYYRTHVQNYGWTDWAVNGEPCGSEGCSYRLEGIQIVLVPKGNEAPGGTANTLFKRNKTQNDMIVRAQEYYSATDWLILTNVTTHMVGVFQWNGASWVLYKEYLTSTGAPWSPTVEGEFIVQAKIPFFGTSTYRCWYATQFWGDYLFHSVLYNVADGPYVVQDGRLGMAISHGCVRMRLEDAKWIYDNIPSGTKVVVYH